MIFFWYQLINNSLCASNPLLRKGYPPPVTLLCAGTQEGIKGCQMSFLIYKKLISLVRKDRGRCWGPSNFVKGLFEQEGGWGTTYISWGNCIYGGRENICVLTPGRVFKGSEKYSRKGIKYNIVISTKISVTSKKATSNIPRKDRIKIGSSFHLDTKIRQFSTHLWLKFQIFIETSMEFESCRNSFSSFLWRTEPGSENIWLQKKTRVLIEQLLRLAQKSLLLKFCLLATSLSALPPIH